MDKSAYQMLRFAVEADIVDFDNGNIDRDSVINSVMRSFLKVIADSQVKQASGKRAFRTFRRDAKTNLPSWAIRNPSLSSRLPIL